MSSQGRHPRAFVRINGTQTQHLAHTVEQNTHFQADTFKVTLEAWQQPDGFGVSFWDGDPNVMLEVLIGTLDDGQDISETPSDPLSLILGQVDDVDIDVHAGTIEITGRDLTGKLIDTKTTQTWPDHTASQIVTDIASQAGLTPQVTGTKTPAGVYYKDSYAHLSREVPLWDLVTFLADREGFDAYVQGTTLFFGPSPAETDSDPIQISCVQDPTANTIDASVSNLKLKRALTFAKDITVTVIGHSVKNGKPVQAVAKRQGASKTAKSSTFSGKSSQNYVFRRPNLTQEQALQLAQKMLADLTIHERTFSAETFEDFDLTARRKATITGTGTAFDTDYYLDKVTRTFSFGELSMAISGKNHPVESDPTLG